MNPYDRHLPKLRSLLVLAAATLAKVCEEGPGALEAYPRIFRLYAICDLTTPERVVTVLANAHGCVVSLRDEIERLPGSPDPAMQRHLDAAGSAITDVLGELYALADDLTVGDLAFTLATSATPPKPPASIFDFSSDSNRYELHGVKSHGFGQASPFPGFPEGAGGLYRVTMKLLEGPAPRVGDKLVFRHSSAADPSPAVLCTVTFAHASPNMSSKAWILCARDDRALPEAGQSRAEVAAGCRPPSP